MPTQVGMFLPKHFIRIVLFFFTVKTITRKPLHDESLDTAAGADTGRKYKLVFNDVQELVISI